MQGSHFGIASEEDIFQRKIEEIFRQLQNVFGITDDFLVVGYHHDGTDPDRTLHRVLLICKNENLKFYEGKCYFRCTSVTFFPNHSWAL